MQGLAKLLTAISLAVIVGAVGFGERRWYAAAPGRCTLFDFARQRGRTGPAQRCAWPRLRVLPLGLLLPLLCEEGCPSVHQLLFLALGLPEARHCAECETLTTETCPQRTIGGIELARCLLSLADGVELPTDILRLLQYTYEVQGKRSKLAICLLSFTFVLVGQCTEVKRLFPFPLRCA